MKGSSSLHFSSIFIFTILSLSMYFQYPSYLFALLALPLLTVLFLLYIQWKKNRTKKIGDPALVQQLISNYSSKKFTTKFILVTSTITLLIIALANLRSPMGNSNVRRSGIDVMIALDVSKSMLAQDIKPNRLERARQLVSKLIDKLPNDRIGIVVFAGKAYLQMPLTTDHAAAKMYLSAISTEMVPTQGTVIGDALKMCYAGFSSKEKKYHAILLISDGEDHDESADKVASLLADEGVMINTVGIGSPEGANIIDAVTGDLKKDNEGKPVVTRLNETGLRKIAETTGGVYQLFTNTDEVADAVDSRLRSMGQKSITESSLASYYHYFPWLLTLALLLLVIDFFMTEKKLTHSTALPAKKTAVLIFCISPFFTTAQKPDELIKKGNEAYRKNKFGEAAGNYQTAAAKAKSSNTAQYNLGNALYKDNKNEDALKAWDASINSSKTNKEKAEAWYNKGVALQNNKKISECIDAYKNALRLNPADEDARLNLQKALKEQKKQQEKKDQQKKQEQKKQPQQQQQPQQPKPQPSKMTKKEAEEKLRALMQQEKNLQDKLHKAAAASPNKPEKDW